jgi:hypothetical protein
LFTDCISTPFYDGIQSKIPTTAFRYVYSSALTDPVKNKFNGCIDLFIDLEEFQGLINKRLDLVLSGEFWDLPELDYRQDRFPWEL